MRVKPDDIDSLLADGKVVLLDVREPWELEEMGTREGYINIPLRELEKRLGELPKDKAILTA
jgi:rhodanese-related sulfurtransferase